MQNFSILSITLCIEEIVLKTNYSPPPNYLFVKRLRIFEYSFNNQDGIIKKIRLLWNYLLYYRISMATGISIPKFTCGKGLTIYHYGSIVVNQATKIGRNCCIMNNVNIGSNQGSDKAPIIGDNVYIGPGAVIFGDITIANGCYVGANAVVNKSIIEENAVVVGAPAKIIKYDPIHWWVKNKLDR